MDGFPRFRPGGNTILISGAIASLGATFVGGPNEGSDYFVYNAGANDAWLGYGMTSDAAKANAVVPLIGSPSPAVALPATGFLILRLAPQLFFAAQTTLGSTNISITPGNGQ